MEEKLMIVESHGYTFLAKKIRSVGLSHKNLEQTNEKPLYELKVNYVDDRGEYMVSWFLSFNHEEARKQYEYFKGLITI